MTPMTETPAPERTATQPTGDLDAPGQAGDSGGREWRWVAEWRENPEPTPWAPGVTLALFSALVIGAAIYVLSDGLATHPLVAIGVNVIVAGGLTPAVWFSRDLPVLRWVGAGAVLGVVGAWISALVFLVAG